MTRNSCIWLGAIALLLQGCSWSIKPEENVIFVTKTSLGLDVDGTPPDVSFAYNRIEGFIGSRYENGAVPPIASHLRSDGGIFSRNVTQFYATGAAAMYVTGRTSSGAVSELQGQRKAMFFGTTTTVGVKINFGETGVGGFVFGLRRKEMSFIPVGSANGADHYASVIGVFSTDAAASKPGDSKLGISSYFATGAAADSIAQWPETQRSFRQTGQDAFDQYREGVAKQDSEVVRIYRCLALLDDSKFPDVLNNANQLKLFQDAKAYDAIKAEKDIKKARAAYIDEIGISVGSSTDRSTRLLGHRVHVCDLAKQSSPN